MRLILKVSAVLLVAFITQCLINGGSSNLDEAQFTARVYLAELRGIPPEAAELLDAAQSLKQRQLARLTYQASAQSAACSWSLHTSAAGVGEY